METAGKIKNAMSGMGARTTSATAALKRIGAPLMKALSYTPFEEIFPSTALCISISQGRLDLLQAKRSLSKYRISAYKSFGFGEDVFPSPDDVATSAAVAMKEFGLKRADVILLVPRSWIIFKSAGLPAAAEDNLRNVIVYEFDRFTPFSAPDAMYDYHSDKEDDNQLHILLAAARGTTLSEYIGKLSAKAITVRRIDFDISAVSTLCGFASGMETFVFAEITPKGCAGGFVRSGRLRSAALTDFPADDDSKKSELIEEFVYGQKKAFAANIASVPVLLSFGDDAANIRSAMVSRAKIPFRTINEYGDKLPGLSGARSLSPAAAGGALESLWPKADGFNLLSRGARDRVKWPFLLTALLASVLAVLLALVMLIPVKKESAHLVRIEGNITKRKAEVMDIEKIRSEIERMIKRTTLVDSFKGERPLYVALVKELTERIPKTAWLTRIRISGSQVNIEGYAASATALVQVLEASRYFRNVEFSSPTFRDPQMGMDRFQIKMEITERKKEAAADEKK
jgi:Tfp pilus assembly protein PilN